MTKRDHYCRDCGRATPQRYLWSENGKHPEIEHWQCATCGLVLLTMGDLPDAEGLCLYVVRESMRRHEHMKRKISVGQMARGDDYQTIDQAEAIGELRLQIWRAWQRFDPDRGVGFRAYATTFLRQRFLDWLRDQHRTGTRALTQAVALDGWDSVPDGRHPVEQALDERALDDPEHHLVPDTGCTVDLSRALGRRGRYLAEYERELSSRNAKVGQ